METPVQITYRGLDPSDSIEANVREHAARLNRFHPRITGCHVTVEMPHQHKHKGKIFRVRVEVAIPGEHVVISHEPAVDHSHEDVYVTLRDAFQAATRRIEDGVRKERSERHGNGPRR